MSTMKAHLNCLLQEARALDEKYYQEWLKIDNEEYPPFDADGNYIQHFLYENKPSKQHENARQLYLAAHYFLYDLERAKNSYETYIKLAE